MENKSLKFKNIYYLPIGRVFVWKTEDDYLIESTEMRTVSKEGMMLEDIKDCWDHIVDYKDKWILDLSTQKGCPYKCMFCDVPKSVYKGNLTKDEIISQLKLMLMSTPYVTKSKDLAIYFARMGEPFRNIDNIMEVILELNNIIPKSFLFTPAINTILPKKISNKSGFHYLRKLIELKNKLNGKLDINISCSTTDQEYQNHLLNNANVYTIEEIIEELNKLEIKGSKIRLNFIIDDREFNFDRFKTLDKNKIELRLTPLTETDNSKMNNLKKGNILNIEKKLKELDIPYHVILTPYMKTFGLGCGQFITLNERKKRKKSESILIKNISDKK
jgi:adenine C2-methylase RlmN of 23S rRNA A2503 and tRNA A37